MSNARRGVGGRVESAWAELARVGAARLGRGGPRALVPVLGSGFVAQAAEVGRRAVGGPRAAAPGWIDLLRDVAQTHGATRARRAIAAHVPGQTTLVWDAMLTELGARTGEPAHGWEARLRRAVAARLVQDERTPALARGMVERLFALRFADVLSFNFDSALLPGGERPTPRAAGALAATSLAASVGDTTVWYPHGHLSRPPSIVLGARAYGARVAAISRAFDEHARVPSPRPTHGLPTWVGTVLERPLLFAGLSLTREEWTIWWWLVQRARLHARRPGGAPPAFVFVRRPPADYPEEARAAFASLSRAASLLDLRLLAFDDFDRGWTRLERALGMAPSRRPTGPRA